MALRWPLAPCRYPGHFPFIVSPAHPMRSAIAGMGFTGWPHPTARAGWYMPSPPLRRAGTVREFFLMGTWADKVRAGAVGLGGVLVPVASASWSRRTPCCCAKCAPISASHACATGVLYPDSGPHLVISQEQIRLLAGVSRAS